MELTDGNVATLSTYLQQTLSPTREERLAAEKFLQSVEGNPGYPILLLMVLSKEDVSMAIRVSASVTFKNFVKRNWRPVEVDVDKISGDDRAKIKTMIVDLMIGMPEQIQRQLSDAISIIGREDFPKDWPELLKHMIDKIATGDFHVINGILRTAHSLFKRYRHEFKSQELWTEIKIVLDGFAAPLTDLFKRTMTLSQEHKDDAAAAKIIYSSLLLICKIFYSLNSQDLPEYFEDNMDVWFSHFLTLIEVKNDLVKSDSDDEPGPLELLKAQVCDNMSLYVEKYSSDCKDYIPRLFEAAYTLLLRTQAPVVKDDVLVTRGIEFLATVINKTDISKQFSDEAVLKQIVAQVIIPNVEYRESDVEAFSDNPEEFIRRDIEGSDVDTRRRSASDLLKALCRFNEAQVMALIGSYIQVMMTNYSSDPLRNWKMKDSAIYLVTSVAGKGQTQKHGITQVSQLVDINDFYSTQILPELMDPNINQSAVLKASSIKYVMTFRTVLSKEVIVSAIPYLSLLLKSEYVVVHSYAAHTLERIYTISGPNGSGTLISPGDIEDSVKQAIIQNLFGVFALAGSAENEYAMKSIMRTLSLLQDQAMTYMEHILNTIVRKMIEASGNPSKPNFNHYLFETLTISIRIMCKANPKAVQVFEAQLFPPFQEILQKDVLEFHPYVFQVLSLLLEQHSEGIPDSYMALYPFLLTPVLWDRPGNIPPLVRLLQAFIEKGSAQIIGGDGSQLTSLLGVFQKLISSKTNDHQGFYLVQSLISTITLAQLTPAHAKSIMILLFTRLSRSKTAKFVKSFLVFVNLFAVRYGGSELIELVDSVQPNMWSMVVERLIAIETQKVSGAVEKKICSVGMTNILCLTPQMAATGKYFGPLWGQTLDAAIRLLQLPTDETDADDEHFVDVEDTPGYQAAFCQLAMAGKKDFDPFKGSIPCPKSYLVTNLQTFGAGFPGKILPVIQQINPESQTALKEWTTAAGVVLG